MLGRVFVPPINNPEPLAIDSVPPTVALFAVKLTRLSVFAFTLKSPLIVRLPVSVLFPVPAIIKLLKVAVGMFCAAPLNETVLPVVVNVLVVGVYVPEIPIVPVGDNSLVPVPKFKLL